jgi:predicted metalloprotease
MRWKGQRASTNVEDRRAFGGGRGLAVGGGLGTLVLLAIAFFFGIDPRTLLQSGPGPARAAERVVSTPEEEELREFVSVVLGNTEDVWNELLGGRYRLPRLVLFRNGVESACGFAAAAVGPFYCPGDERVYLDLAFFDELSARFGAPGDFAQAYVLAHEVGHHVQNLLGTMDEVHAAQARASDAEANRISVALELQADYYAGVWGHHARRQGLLEQGDLEEALKAASAIGDDRLQLEAQGYVVPDSFTHGSSEERLRWFRRGFDSGDPGRGDTFAELGR